MFGLYFGAPAHASLTYRVVKRREYERIVNRADRRKILNMTSPHGFDNKEMKNGNETK